MSDNLPAYVRCFVCTDGSALGVLALELCRSMHKVAPVRAISMSGTLIGRWMSAAKLTTTPMIGSYVNVVACDPSRWTWLLRVPMPARDAWQSAVSDVDIQGLGTVEEASERKSLYTAGVRNILYAIAPPRSKVELTAALAFESILVSDQANCDWWVEHAGRTPRVIGNPIDDALVREEICG